MRLIVSVSFLGIHHPWHPLPLTPASGSHDLPLSASGVSPTCGRVVFPPHVDDPYHSLRNPYAWRSRASGPLTRSRYSTPCEFVLPLDLVCLQASSSTASLGVPLRMDGATSPFTLTYHVDFLTLEVDGCRVCTSVTCACDARAGNACAARAGACPHRLSHWRTSQYLTVLAEARALGYHS